MVDAGAYHLEPSATSEQEDLEQSDRANASGPHLEASPRPGLPAATIILAGRGIRSRPFALGQVVARTEADRIRILRGP
jgi:hypothetical protein